MGLLRTKCPAESDDEVLIAEAERAAEGELLRGRPLIAVPVGVDAVVDHLVDGGVHAVGLPVPTLALADVDEAVASVEQRPVEEHARPLCAGAQRGGVKHRGEARSAGARAAAGEVAVEHRVRVGAHDRIDPLLEDEPAQPPHRPGIDPMRDVQAEKPGQPLALELGQQLLVSLQVRQMEPETARIQMVEERDQLLFRAAGLQRIDQEEHRGGARGLGRGVHAPPMAALARGASAARAGRASMPKRP